MSVLPARSSRAPDLRAVAVALGSNVGDRESHLQHALGRLRDLLDSLRVSSFHETVPEGVPTQQPLFLNAVAVGLSREAPQTLLTALQAIEAERGRTRPAPYRGAPRTLDLDLLVVGGEMVDSVRLTLPHPRFRERRFVLAPFTEVAPELVDPVTGCTIGELYRRLEDAR